MVSKIINLYGGPSTGKSTIAAGLFYELKRRGISADIPYEFPKALAWDSNLHAIKDQFFVIGNQHRGISRSWGKVEYIIVDSPLLLALVYKDFYSETPYYPSTYYRKEFTDFIVSLHNQYESYDIVLNRNEKKFQDEGRYQDLEQSKIVDTLIINTLESNHIEYVRFDVNDDTVQSILNLIGIK